MRSLLTLLIGAILVLLSGFLWAELQKGSQLRELEVQAAAHSEAIMRALEAHRLQNLDQEQSPLYVTLERLQEDGLLEGFTSLPTNRGSLLHARDEYLYLVQLLPSSNPESIRPQLGQRYRLWAWPRSRAHLGLVLFYGSSAGYLFQGENGEVSGTEPMLPERTPLQALDASPGGRSAEARRWKQLVDIRSS